MASGTPEIKGFVVTPQLVKSEVACTVLANACILGFLFPMFTLDNSWGKQNSSHSANNWLEHHLTLLLLE